MEMPVHWNHVVLLYYTSTSNKKLHYSIKHYFNSLVLHSVSRTQISLQGKQEFMAGPSIDIANKPLNRPDRRIGQKCWMGHPCIGRGRFIIYSSYIALFMTNYKKSEPIKGFAYHYPSKQTCFIHHLLNSPNIVIPTIMTISSLVKQSMLPYIEDGAYVI